MFLGPFEIELAHFPNFNRILTPIGVCRNVFLQIRKQMQIRIKADQIYWEFSILTNSATQKSKKFWEKYEIR